MIATRHLYAQRELNLASADGAYEIARSQLKMLLGSLSCHPRTMERWRDKQRKTYFGFNSKYEIDPCYSAFCFGNSKLRLPKLILANNKEMLPRQLQEEIPEKTELVE